MSAENTTSYAVSVPAEQETAGGGAVAVAKTLPKDGAAAVARTQPKPRMCCHVSGDEIEALITVHGVLCAFLLSIAVAVTDSYSYEGTERALYNGLIAKTPGFRAHVFKVLNATEGGFAWKVDVGTDTEFDIQYELLEGIDKRFPPSIAPYCACWQNDFGFADLAYDLGVQTAAALTFPHFPMERMQAYLIHHPLVYNTDEKGGPAAVLASAFLFAAIAVNMIIYLAYLISPAKESEAALATFQKTSMPVIIFTYALLILGVLCMVWGQTQIGGFSSPLMAKATTNFGFVYNIAWIGATVVPLPFLAVSFLASRAAYYGVGLRQSIGVHRA
jgi:hypothetical protein